MTTELELKLKRLERRMKEAYEQLNAVTVELQAEFGEDVYVTYFEGDGLAIMVDRGSCPTGVPVSLFIKFINDGNTDIYQLKTYL